METRNVSKSRKSQGPPMGLKRNILLNWSYQIPKWKFLLEYKILQINEKCPLAFEAN